MRNRVDGDGKTDIVNGCAAVGRIAVFGIGDPNDLSVQIKQRAAGVTGIDRGDP